MPSAAVRFLGQPKVGEVCRHPTTAHSFVWTEQHPPLRALEELRWRGDNLADRALASFNQLKLEGGARQDLIDYLKDAPDLECSVSKPLGDFWSQVRTVPAWVDWKLVGVGQQVFWKYCFPIVVALLHASLPGGYAISSVNKVLMTTGYLSSCAVGRRIIETYKMIADAMHGVADLQPGGKGWESVIRVRILHAKVRAAVLRRGVANRNVYDVDADGIPINQEDLTATLLTFSVVTVNAMKRVGLDLRRRIRYSESGGDIDELAAFYHTWRYIGYLSGVGEDVNPLYDVDVAHASDEAITLHLAYPDHSTAMLVSNLLHGTVHHPPLSMPLSKKVALTRAFLGGHLADQLSVPQLSRTGWCRAQLTVATFHWYRWLYELELAPLRHMLPALYGPRRRVAFRRFTDRLTARYLSSDTTASFAFHLREDLKLKGSEPDSALCPDPGHTLMLSIVVLLLLAIVSWIR